MAMRHYSKSRNSSTLSPAYVFAAMIGHDGSSGGVVGVLEHVTAAFGAHVKKCRRAQVRTSPLAP
jgi:hypothetical protein